MQPLTRISLQRKLSDPDLYHSVEQVRCMTGSLMMNMCTNKIGAVNEHPSLCIKIQEWNYSSFFLSNSIWSVCSDRESECIGEYPSHDKLYSPSHDKLHLAYQMFYCLWNHWKINQIKKPWALGSFIYCIFICMSDFCDNYFSILNNVSCQH